jgi:hypothetical protein
MTSRILRGSLATLVSALATTAAFACVDSQGDFDAYIDKTNDIRGVVPDTGVRDAAPLEVGDADLDAGKTIYWGNCLPQIVTGAPQSSLMYYSEITFSGGKADVAFYPLNEKAKTLSKSETVGTPQIATGLEIKPDNTFVATMGDVKVPGNSQRIGDSELVLTNVSYQMVIQGKERLCAELQGTVTAPLSASLEPKGDICVWIQLPDGAPLPTQKDASGGTFVGLANEDFRCP